MRAVEQAPREERLAQATRIADRLVANIETVVRDKREEVKLVLAALACGGHVLFEDVPGTGKTVLARTLAGSVEDLAFARIQCTPDLQPTDVTGLAIYNQKARDFEFRPGPLFANVVLVDEINRAMPKTQSALLEAMAERQVTIDGATRPLPQPFILLATENPIEFEGVFPLPEAQLDRFFVKARLGYPSLDDELGVIVDQRHAHPLERLRPAVGAQELQALANAVAEVYIDALILRWIVELARATRSLDAVVLGASVRGSLALERAARAWALLHERDYVVPADVGAMFAPVLGHRLVFSPEFVAETRRLQKHEALQLVYERCLELAPPPAGERH